MEGGRGAGWRVPLYLNILDKCEELKTLSGALFEYSRHM